MRPDHRLRESDAEEVLRHALREYAETHEATDLVLYVAHTETPVTWNELQSRANCTPSELSSRLLRVEEHLRHYIGQYLEG